MEKKTVVDALTIIRSEYERNPARSMLAIGSSESCRKSTGDVESCIGASDEQQGRIGMDASKLIGDHGWVSKP